ncbi:hypothetical protein ACRE1S_04195 [Helicobacter himalayensis]|uniref:hypothetical protein n=1 Tax=Helicobacter himalayensis TaxID=1591088 RepID=UPI003D6F7D39
MRKAGVRAVFEFAKNSEIQNRHFLHFCNFKKKSKTALQFCHQNNKINKPKKQNTQRQKSPRPKCGREWG